MTCTDRLTKFQRVALNADLLVNESVISFVMHYIFPNIQTLGMSLKLVSFTGLIAGPLGFFLIPLLGWWSDQGPNPNRRKMLNVLLAGGILVFGTACVLLANIMHINTLSQQLEVNCSSVSTSGDFQDGHQKLKPQEVQNETSSLSGLQAASCQSHHTEVPFKAVLGMLGFTLIEVGYDSTNSFARSWVVTCSPRPEHTPMLVIGLVLASVGGVFTAALGVMDFKSVLGLSSLKGGSMALQVIVQGTFLVLAIVIGRLFSVITGLHRLQEQRKKEILSIADGMSVTSSSGSSNHDTDPDEPSSKVHQDHENISHDVSNDGNTIDDDIIDEMDDDQSVMSDENRRILPESSEKRKKVFGSKKKNSCIQITYGTNDPTSESASGKDQKTGLQEQNTKREKLTLNGCANQSMKCTMTLICLAMWQGAGAIYAFSLMASDYVGKAIYGGRPRAMAGSESMTDYQHGITASSWGYVIYYSFYLMMSLANFRLLKMVGYKVEFTVVQLLLVSQYIVLAMTARIEAFFVLSAMAGIHRTCTSVVPYAAANDVMQAEADRTKNRNAARMGQTMAVVTGMMPLAYASLIPWVGPLDVATGMVSLPLWLGAAYGCFALVFFLSVAI